MAETSKWKVYISSTFNDFRSELINLFQNQLQNNFELCKIMERMFDDGSYTPFVEDCIEAVEDSDIYIIILGNNIGSFPPDEKRTYTEIELDTAITSKKNIFCLHLKEFDLIEIDNPEKHQNILNKFLGRPTHTFHNLTEIENCVFKCLLPYASTSPINKNNPYKGLAAFNVDDGDYFFGRDTEIEECLKKIILSKENIFISIIGNSGIGKSSFVQAGVLHRLKTEKKLGFSAYTQVTVLPGQEPFSNLQYQLKLKGINIEDLIDENDFPIELILFFNQFEEIISQCHSEKSIKEREKLFGFLDLITNSKKQDLKIIILTTFRSDFLSQLANCEFIKNHQIFIPLNSLDYTLGANNWEKSIKEIIVNPALKNKVLIEDTLVSQLTNEIKEVEGSLSILQFTLEKIWNENTIKDRVIDSSEYNAIADGKGISGILESHAESVVNRITQNGVDKEREAILKSIFINLVEVNENLLDVKRTAKKEELFAKLGGYYDPNIVRSVFEDLVSDQSRLLVVTKDKEDTNNVDIIHEVLIRKWQRIKNWIDERREALIYQKDLKKDIYDYEKGKEKLYTRRKWKAASNWQIKNPDLNDDKIKFFIEKSKKRTRLRAFCTIGVMFMFLPLYFILEPILDRGQLEMDIQNYNNIKQQIIGNGGIDSVKALNIDGNLRLLKKIAYFKQLRSLVINDFAFKDFSELQGEHWLEELHFLDSLYIENNDNLKSLKGIEVPSGLVYLEISRNSSLKNLNCNAKFKNVKCLKIINNSNLKNLKGIENFANLQSLTMNKNDVLKDLRGMPTISTLTYLEVSDDELSSLKGIENFSNLKDLVILGALGSKKANLFSLNGIEKLHKLKSLKIFRLENLGNISHIKTLNELEINRIDNLKNLNELKDLTNIKSLRILNNINLISLKGIENLSNMENLAIISIEESNLSSLTGIEKLHKLKSLEISGLTKLKSHNLVDIDCLSTINQLKIRNIDHLKDLNNFKRLTNVKTLEISSNEDLISLQGINYLRKIESLGIYFNNNLNDFSGIEKLINLKDLVIIFNTKQINFKEINLLLNSKIDLKRIFKIIKLLNSKKAENLEINKDDSLGILLWTKPGFQSKTSQIIYHMAGDDLKFLIIPKRSKTDTTWVKKFNPEVKIFTYNQN